MPALDMWRRGESLNAHTHIAAATPMVGEADEALGIEWEAGEALWQGRDRADRQVDLGCVEPRCERVAREGNDA